MSEPEVQVESSRSEIAVTVDGPYEVSGDIPVVPKRIIRSEEGESLAWATGTALPHEDPTYLCRCGQSQDKPFCDNSHLTADFDGTESASTEPFFERSRTYEGTGVKVHRVGPICQHAAFCINQATDWHQMLSDTDDTNVRTQLIGMVEHCPSGALVYELDGEVVEPDLPIAISPVEDGPLWVTGGVPIVRSDGIPLEPRNRVTLCRCGQSKNKPLCDGTHSEIGFEARNPGTESTTETESNTDTEPATEEVPGPFKRVVVAVGESTPFEVFAVASMVAGTHSTVMSLVHSGQEGAESEQLLTSAREFAVAAGVPRILLGSELRTEAPASALSAFVEEADAGLLIMGRGGTRLGAVPHRVSYHSPCDLLIVAESKDDHTDRYERILIATDGSATADRAARRGYDLARALDASVDLVFVGHPTTGELIVTDTIAMYGDGVATEEWMLVGEPVAAILETAGMTDADLIVVGNKGMARSRRRLGASVPGGVIKDARCDVLLCRTVRQLESDLEPGDGGVIERHGETLAAFVDEGGELHLMSARCTHLDCLVVWNPTEKTFDCPCHGSRFGPSGEVVDGPASKPLRPA
jgi:CDGSH-type Zn-finger protein/nitrite reductase/ring-hydroxylating ferredoxin subunit